MKVAMEPRVIKTDEQYRHFLSEVERLAGQDPDPESVEGGRLELLAKLVEAEIPVQGTRGAVLVTCGIAQQYERLFRRAVDAGEQRRRRRAGGCGGGRDVHAELSLLNTGRREWSSAGHPERSEGSSKTRRKAPLRPAGCFTSFSMTRPDFMRSPAAVGLERGKSGAVLLLLELLDLHLGVLEPRLTHFQQLVALLKLGEEFRQRH